MKKEVINNEKRNLAACDNQDETRMAIFGKGTVWNCVFKSRLPKGFKVAMVLGGKYCGLAEM